MPEGLTNEDIALIMLVDEWMRGREVKETGLSGLINKGRRSSCGSDKAMVVYP